MKPKAPEGTARRLLAAGVLASLAAVTAFRILWVEPRLDLLAMRRAELEQSRAEIVRVRRAAGRLQALEAEVERLRRRDAALRRALPDPRAASALLRRLQGIAVQSGLTVEAFTLDPVRAGEPLQGCSKVASDG